MNFLRNFQSSSVVFDFEISGEGNRFRFLSDPAFNGKVFRTAGRKTSDIGWLRDLRRITRQNQYSHVHIHSSWASAEVLLALSGIESVKVVHNHQVFPHPGACRSAKWQVAGNIIRRNSDFRFACSEPVGEQMFLDNFEIVPNVVEYAKHRFNLDDRSSVRHLLGISPRALVLGHIGHYETYKNHDFLLEILAELVRSDPNWTLVLVGSGDTRRQKFEWAVDRAGLRGNVQILGDRSDAAKLMNGFDVFAFPSLYEGFGMALLEAQINGVPSVYSAGIPQEAVIADYAYELDLCLGPRVWADRIRSVAEDGANCEIRSARSSSVSRTYDAVVRAPELEDFYLRTARR